MKLRIKRMTSMAVVMVILCNIILPTFCEYANFLGKLVARAEQREIPWAFSLEEEELGDVQERNGWQYALRAGDGYAVITGYTGRIENSITVPARINGVDVVGLASNALAYESLQDVHLHGNILWIAEDAFGEYMPTIHALNGTYALYYAFCSNMQYEIPRDYQLVPGVIDYTDVLDGRIIKRGETRVVINELEAMRLQVGSIFWFEDSRGLEHFYEVVELSDIGDEMLVTVEESALEETIIELHVEDTITVTADDFIPADGVKVIDEAATLRSIIRDTEERSWRVNCRFGADGKINGKAEICLDINYHMTVNYRYDVVDGKVVHAETTENTTYEYTISGTTADTYDGFENLNEEMIKKLKKSENKLISKLFLGKIYIGTPLIRVLADMSFNAEFAGTVNVVNKQDSIVKKILWRCSGVWKFLW